MRGIPLYTVLFLSLTAVAFASRLDSGAGDRRSAVQASLSCVQTSSEHHDCTVSPSGATYVYQWYLHEMAYQYGHNAGSPNQQLECVRLDGFGEVTVVVTDNITGATDTVAQELSCEDVADGGPMI